MAVVRAAKRRIGLGGYLDYLVLGVPLAWLMWLYAWVNPDVDRLPWAVRLISFLVLEVLLVRQVRWSPGSSLLGISVLTPTALEEGSQETLAGRRFVVDAFLKREERWWTLLLGVFLVLDGAKAFMPYALVMTPAVITIWLVLVALRARHARRFGAASIVGPDQLQQQ
jgi:hypothetical protein